MTAQMALLQFHVIPGAKTDEIVGQHSGSIKIKLRAPAREGKANAALCNFLAEQLKIPKRAIVLKRGHKSREKLIRIDGLTEEEARRRLLQAT